MFTRYGTLSGDFTDFFEKVPTEHPIFQDTNLQLTGVRMAAQVPGCRCSWWLYTGRDELAFYFPVTEAEAIAWVAEGVLPDE
jgi:hypothetical protein